MSRSLEYIAAAGAGRMGRGIATAFAYAGHPVSIVDLKPRTSMDAARLREEALAEVKANLVALAELGVLQAVDVERIVGRVEFADERQSGPALARAEFVFEGVPETLDAKRDAFARLGRLCRKEAVLASTTSTMLSSQLAGLVEEPGRFLNAHWLNPAYVVPLVELSPHVGTRTQVVASLRALLESVGKVPVVCGASPGYIVPRLQTLIMNEAARMVDEGVATAEEIDRAARFGFGFRFASIGVVEFIDYGGVEILYHASRYLANTMDAPRYAPPAIVEHKMNAGDLGLQTGQGFYDYRSMDTGAYRKDVLSRAVNMLRSLGLHRPPR